jgi:hypothetical protein
MLPSACDDAGNFWRFVLQDVCLRCMVFEVLDAETALDFKMRIFRQLFSSHVRLCVDEAVGKALLLWQQAKNSLI